MPHWLIRICGTWIIGAWFWCERLCQNTLWRGKPRSRHCMGSNESRRNYIRWNLSASASGAAIGRSCQSCCDRARSRNSSWKSSVRGNCRPSRTDKTLKSGRQNHYFRFGYVFVPRANQHHFGIQPNWYALRSFVCFFRIQPNQAHGQNLERCAQTYSSQPTYFAYWR